MKTYKVPDMHCINCVNRIKKALDAENIAADVDLGSKTVSVKEADAKKTLEILDDLGFDAE